MGQEKVFRTPRERRFYRRLRDRVKRWARRRDMPERRLEYLLAAPDLFVLLSRLALDERVPIQTKAKVTARIAYFVSPLDMIPDFLGPPGFLDDVVVAAWILNTVVVQLNELDPAILEEHWEGEQDVLEHVTQIVDQAEKVLGKGLSFVVRRLRRGRAPHEGRG
ncbi:MAG: YkvA family protein [Chloroflexota bacterium]|nr:YkvA family protein [Chloroflexota bacterium]